MMLSQVVAFRRHGARAPERSRGSVAEAARRRIENHSCFAQHPQCVNVEFDEGTLTLTGRLPTFYLKQVLQSLVCDLPGVERVDNRVAVVSSSGLSSIVGEPDCLRKGAYPW